MPEPNLTEILQMLTRIQTTLETIAQNSADHEARLRKLEGRGGAHWDALMMSAISALVVGVLGFFLGKQ